MLIGLKWFLQTWAEIATERIRGDGGPESTVCFSSVEADGWSGDSDIGEGELSGQAQNGAGRQNDDLLHYEISESVLQHSHSDSPGVMIDRLVFLVNRLFNRVFPLTFVVPKLV